MTRVLGLDPGLAETGYGVIEVRRGMYVHVDHGCISTSAELPTGQRLEKIQREILEVIRRFRPSSAGVESLYFAKNISSAIPVAQARGVLLLTLAQTGIPAREFAPQEIKMAISGTGRASKFQVQDLVRLLIGLPELPTPDHAADALAAAICCYNTRSSEALILGSADV